MYIGAQTKPVGFSNDFMVAAPQHPFLSQMIAALPSWNRRFGTKYPTVMFSTGPMFVSYQVPWSAQLRVFTSSARASILMLLSSTSHPRDCALPQCRHVSEPDACLTALLLCGYLRAFLCADCTFDHR